MLLALIACGSVVAPPPQAPDPLLSFRDRAGKQQPVRGPADWQRRRESILRGMQQAMGPLRSRTGLPPLDLRTHDTTDLPAGQRRRVSFASADGNRIPAYLYLPAPRGAAARPCAAILALHPTSPLGKGVVDGQGPLPNRAYARELAGRGYVVLAPDYPSFGDYRYDFDADDYGSGTMKGIADHMRAVDLLQSLPAVDGDRIGVIGHSLGGHNALFVAAFDRRLRAVVTSCGWTPFPDYQGGALAGWTSKRYMPWLRDRFDLDPRKVPFDFDEVIAALAPRAVFTSSPLRDDNFDVDGVRRALARARPVFQLLGAPHNLVAEHPDCDHDFPPAVRERAYRFLDRSLGRGRPELVGTATFVPTPRSGVRTNARAFYSRATGRQMMSVHSHQTRSDTADVAFTRFSADNGRTWSTPTEVRTHEPRANGTFRRYLSSALAVAEPDVLVMMILQGVLPADDPLAGMRHWTLRYGLSRDGGRTFWHEAPVVQVGAPFSAAHPLPGVRVGRNAAMIGATACAAIRLPSGEILQPIQVTPTDRQGNFHNPGGGYTYHDAAVLIGRFNTGGTIDWQLSQRVEADPRRSTRGLLEPTVVAAPDGRILMVMRGSNDRRPALPGRRWFAVSRDRGRSWSAAAPWTYHSGRPFYSPSSCSQLLRHGNGRIYWLGNIATANPRGNHPRFPLLIGEVDPVSLRLIEASLTRIDTRRPGDTPGLQLSNFFAYEDRDTAAIVVHCTPIGRRHPLAKAAGTGFDWTGDALTYRIRVPR